MRYNCTCTAAQKTGLLHGVHDAGCRTYQRIYPEVWVPRDGESAPTFPQRCPACREAKTSETFEHSTANPYDTNCQYACGGSYTLKSQIQNHTDKWWGKCGIE